MKTIKILVLLMPAVLVAALLTPEFPDSPARRDEDVTALLVSDNGNRLLIRTPQHDYEFALPPNHLLEVTAYSPPAMKLGQWSVGELNVSADGHVTVQFPLRGDFGGYNHARFLTAEERTKMVEWGFKPNPDDRNDDESQRLLLEIPLTTGQQYEALGRTGFTGIELPGQSSITVHAMSLESERGRTINAWLSPLIAIKIGLMRGLVLVILLVTGFRPGA